MASCFVDAIRVLFAAEFFVSCLSRGRWCAGVPCGCFTRGADTWLSVRADLSLTCVFNAAPQCAATSAIHVHTCEC